MVTCLRKEAEMKIAIQIALLLVQITAEAVRGAVTKAGKAATDTVNSVLDPP